jgi:hypothetical protein
MGNKKQLKTDKQKERRKYFSGRQVRMALFIGLILFFVYHSSIRTIENVRLARNGLPTRAVVIERKDVGGAAGVALIYTFYVEGIRYESEQSNEPYQVGDTIDILYLAANPRITRTYRFISDNYKVKTRLERAKEID